MNEIFFLFNLEILFCINSLQYKWLNLNDRGESVCKTCCEAVEKKLPLPKGIRCSRALKAFVIEGFDSWKNAVQRFANHERSKFHIAA